MSQVSDNLCKEIYERFNSDEIDNGGLVQIIELVGSLLNLRTRSKYAKDTGKSYNGVKKFRQNIELFGTKYVINNE
jgi:hypothetical protein